MNYLFPFLFPILFFIFINKSLYKKIFIFFISSSFVLSYFLDEIFFINNWVLILLYFLLHCLFFSLILPDSKLFIIEKVIIQPIIKKIMLLSFFNVFLLCFIVYYMYSQLTLLDVTIGEFKNENIASNVVSNSYVKYLLFISRVLSPFGYLALFILIIKLISNDYKNYFYYVIISFNIPLIHMIAFSRSFIVLYLLSLFFIFLKYYKCFPLELRFKLSKKILYLLLLISFAFISITYYRFESMSYWGKFKGSSYDNIIIFSIIYYFSSWIKVSLLIVSDLPVTIIGVYHDILSLPNFIINKFGYSLNINPFDYQSFSSEFKGLLVSILYDQGVLLSLVSLTFIIIFRVIISYIHDIKIDLMYSMFFIFLSVAFFFGNLFVYIDFVLAFLYLLLFKKFITVK